MLKVFPPVSQCITIGINHGELRGVAVFISGRGRDKEVSSRVEEFTKFKDDDAIYISLYELRSKESFTLSKTGGVCLGVGIVLYVVLGFRGTCERPLYKLAINIRKECDFCNNRVILQKNLYL